MPYTRDLPAMGLGTSRSEPEKLKGIIKHALRTGYRLIDTAAAYHNERQVGEAVKESGIPRSEICVTSKLWLTDFGCQAAGKGLRRSLENLGLDFVDLYLVHWPVPAMFDATIEAYAELHRLSAKGYIGAVGVSNFSKEHLSRLLDRTGLLPLVNQIELNPFFPQQELRSFHSMLGVRTQAWAPIGGRANRNQQGTLMKGLLDHPVVLSIAERCKKTSAQVVLRWHLQRGIIPLPKSSEEVRVSENHEVFDFVLVDDDVRALDALDTGIRRGLDPDSVSMNTFRKAVGDDA